MDWIKLVTDFDGHPKLLSVGNAGAGLYARSLAYCGKYETNGVVPIEWVEQAVAREGQTELPQQMVEAGLWCEHKSGYEIRDFTEVNKSREEMTSLRAKRSDAGQAGGLAKARRGAKQKRGKSPSNSSSSSSSRSRSSSGETNGSVARAKVAGKAVTDAERDTASAILDAFNSAANSEYTLDAHLTPLVMRIRERPGLSTEAHRQVITANFANPWWDDRPGVEVIYGNKRAFERALERAKGPQPLGTKPDFSEYDKTSERFEVAA